MVFDDILRYSLDTVVLETDVFVEPDDEFTKEPEKVYFKRWYKFYSITIRLIFMTSNDNVCISEGIDLP